MSAKRPEVSGLYEFGPFVLNTTQRLLIKNGSSVSLAPKAFDLLVVLVQNRGSLVTKDQLYETVWRGVAIEDGSITYHVSLLRKALSDQYGAPRYVATVSKHGYRFIAPVKILTPSSNGGPAFETESNSSPVREAVSPSTTNGSLSLGLDHPWHLLAVSFLYGLYYSVSFMLEVAYEYETYGRRALSIAPIVFLWVMGTSLLGLRLGWKRTARGLTSGVSLSLFIFIGAALILYLGLALFLPNIAITRASFQTYPAQGAFLKSVYYVLPLVVLFVVLPSHYIVAKEREVAHRPYPGALESERSAHLAGAGVYLKTWWLAVMLFGAFCVTLASAARLFENLQASPNTGLFIQLSQWRFVLYFLLGLECILWYQQAQRPDLSSA